MVAQRTSRIRIAWLFARATFPGLTTAAMWLRTSVRPCNVPSGVVMSARATGVRAYPRRCLGETNRLIRSQSSKPFGLVKEPALNLRRVRPHISKALGSEATTARAPFAVDVACGPPFAVTALPLCAGSVCPAVVAGQRHWSCGAQLVSRTVLNVLALGA